MPRVSFEHITKTYGQMKVLDDQDDLMCRRILGHLSFDCALRRPLTQWNASFRQQSGDNRDRSADRLHHFFIHGILSLSVRIAYSFARFEIGDIQARRHIT